MAGSVAGTIQGEAGSNPANQFAVASTIWNRLKAGTYGGSASAIVNAPKQYTGYASPNASATAFAQAIENGTFPQYGNPGNAVNFQTAGSDTTLGRDPAAVNIGGNNFSDRFGTPTANFVPPQYGGSGVGSNLPQVPDYSGTFMAPDLGANGGGNVNQYLDPYASGGNVPIDRGGGYASGLTSGSFSRPPVDFANLGLGGDLVAGGSGYNFSPFNTGTGDLGLSSDLSGTLGSNSQGLGDSTASGLTNPLTGVANLNTGPDFFQTVFNILGNFFTRAGLVLLGIILLGIGLWAMARGDMGAKLKKAVA